MAEEIARDWMLSAMADLKTMDHLLDDEYLTHIVAFHAQQCIEKSFKSLLEFNSLRVPKEHSTIRLFGMIKDIVELEIDTYILVDLDDLYIESRYPGDLGLLPNGKPGKEDAVEFYNFARKIFDDIQKHLDLKIQQ